MPNHGSNPNESDVGEHRPDQPTQWHSFVQRLDSGNPEAMKEVFDRYSEQLVRLASKNIHPTLVKRFDGEDVVQSVFRTFFRRQQEGKITVQHSHQLWNLLVKITLCKTRTHARRHTAECRNVQGEQTPASEDHLVAPQASPQEAIALWEEIDIVMKGLPGPTSEILAHRLEGKTKTEIAHDLNLSRQTIHRLLKLLEERLAQRLEFFLTDGNSSCC